MADVSDSAPAPMVQLPADKVEALREALRVWGTDYISGARGEVLTAARAVVDAATPAASVPAAECHEEVTRKGHLEPCEKPAVAMRIDPTEGTPYPVCVKHTRADMVPLRALVAAAEQADEGEAAATPRDEPEYDAHLGTTIVPAAPPEPLCRCGHAYREHGYLFPAGPCGAQFDGCEAFEPRVPPEPLCDHKFALIISDEDYERSEGWCSGCGVRMRNDAKRGWEAVRVPVNDEAEAASRDELIELVGDALGHSVEGCTCFADGTNQMCAVCIPVAVAIVDALAARQGGNSDE